MAFTVRTIDEIFTELLTEKGNLTSLDGLISGSITDTTTLIPQLENGQAPDWVLWLYNMAVQTNLTESPPASPSVGIPCSAKPAGPSLHANEGGQAPSPMIFISLFDLSIC